MLRGFPADSDLRAIDLKQAWVAKRRTARGGNYRAGQKAEFHQAPGIGLGQFNGIEHRRFTRVQIGQPGPDGRRGRSIFAIELQFDSQYRTAGGKMSSAAAPVCGALGPCDGSPVRGFALRQVAPFQPVYGSRSRLWAMGAGS